MPSGKLQFALLRDLDDATRQAVVAACTPRRFARREVVLREGDPGDCLHLVVSGRFAVRVATPHGDAVTLRVVGAGGVFGELVLLDPHARRAATVAALEPAATLALTATRFAALRSRHPQVDRVLVAMLADNVRRLSGQVLEALYAPVDERVARRVHELAQVYGAEVPVTQDELAAMAGTTRASANLALRRLAGRGAVAVARGRIVVRDPAALGRVAGAGVRPARSGPTG